MRLLFTLAALLAFANDALAQSEPDGTTALHWAAHRGDAAEVARLLHAGADANVANDYGATPLSEAAARGDAASIALLLKAGAQADKANAEGQTPLMAVARTGNVQAARLLLKAGANVDARERWGEQSALMWAAAQRQPEMAKLLAKHGAEVNARGAVRDWQRRFTAEPRPKGQNRGGFTPLLYAAREGCVACVQHLLDAGADIDLPDPERVSPLLIALLNLRFDTATLLIRRGADVDKWDLYGNSPLYVAIDMNTLPRGGRPDLPSEDATTALQVAEQLLARGANPDLQLKVRPPYRNYIYDRGGDTILATGATPLLRAAKGGDVAAIALLLRHHAKVDLPNAEGVTPLMAAAGMGQGANPTRGRFKTDAEAAECVRLLRAGGARIDARNSAGTTALHGAAAQGWDDTLRVLIEQGAELEPLDGSGLTPLDYAAGRYPRAFLGPEAKPRATTIQLLRERILASTGHAAKESTAPPPAQTRGTSGS